MTKQTIRAPFANGEADQLSKRVFRKQILKFGEIDYHGRVVKFDKPYAEDVIKAFRDQAFDTVPFVLADKDNKHTRDPERARGEIIDLEATDSGLDAVISLNKNAATLVEENPKLGVSVSIKEQFARADGKYYDRALAHVLGTFEPMLPGMSAWQTINASDTEDNIIDLTQVDLAAPKEKEKGMPKFTEAQQEEMFSKLAQLLEALESDDDTFPDPNGAPDPDNKDYDVPDDEDEDEDGEELTDQDIAELREFLAQVDGKVPATVNASVTDDPRTIELSAALQRQQDEIVSLRAENDRRLFEAEKEKLVRTVGIPPYIIDMARPLLEGSGHSVELSDSTEVDAGEIVRKVFTEFGKQIKVLDLSGELGNSLALTGEQDNHADTMSKVKALRKQMNI